jgi:hypothetical protein
MMTSTRIVGSHGGGGFTYLPSYTLLPSITTIGDKVDKVALT